MLVALFFVATSAIVRVDLKINFCLGYFHFIWNRVVYVFKNYAPKYDKNDIRPITPHSWSTLSQKATSIATNYIQFSSFLWAFTWYHSWKEWCGSKCYIFKNLMNYFLKLLLPSIQQNLNYFCKTCQMIVSRNSSSDFWIDKI